MKTILIGLATAIVLAFGIGMLLGGEAPSRDGAAIDGSNVVVVDGKQIVTIKAKGGYRPESTMVKSGMPVVLRIQTSGTFDCSSALAIPSLGITKDLPPTGTTDIELGSLPPGTLQATCGMGMYRFQIVAQG